MPAFLEIIHFYAKLAILGAFLKKKCM